MGKKNTVRRLFLLVFALALLGVMPMASANGVPVDDSWQIGDVETIAGGVASTNPADEFNWTGATATGGPGLNVNEPVFADPFIVGTTATSLFPYNSNAARGYATDFDVVWDGELVCGGDLTFSWSPGKSASETKVTTADGDPLGSFTRTPASLNPSFAWVGYKFFEDTVAVPPLLAGPHTFNFQHTTGDGTFWDWVRLDEIMEVGNAQTFDLIAGGGDYPSADPDHGWVDVGYVKVWNDATKLYVQYFTDVPEWRFIGIHLHVADDVLGIPQTKKGKPIPGQFDTSEFWAYPGVPSTSVYEFPLADFDGTPVIAAHAELIDISGLENVTDPGENWALNVLDSNQGLRWNGTAVLPERSIPTDALDEPDAEKIENVFYNFFSLGFGGSIVVDFGAPIYNGAPNDLTGVEVTGGGYPEESAKVEFLYDGVWHLGIGELTNTGSTALQRETFVQMPAGIPYADAVRITDTTNPTLFNSKPTADGYDLDAVKVSQLGSIRGETGWGDGEFFPGSKDWSMYLDYTSYWGCPID